jgi:hypothetical protein
MTIADEVKSWVEKMRPKIGAKGIDADDLDALIGTVMRTGGQKRQRLLYLHSSGMSVLSPVFAMDLREPTRQPNGYYLEPEPKIPYNSVHDAIVDGWRVIHFPNQAAPFDDREINILGYEFILEKLEDYDD